LENLNTAPPPRNPGIHYLFALILLGWLGGMVYTAEPSPLRIPEAMLSPLQSLLGLPESESRVLAALVLRCLGIAMIGLLLAGTLVRYPWKSAALIVLLWAPLLAMGVKSIQYGYFPLRIQILFILFSAWLGGVTGLFLRRRLLAIAGLLLLVTAGLVWGWSTRIGDDLNEAANDTFEYLLSQSNQVPAGKEGFIHLLRLAFAFAEENSRGRGSDPVFANKAAILGLGMVLGDEQFDRLGGRELDSKIKWQRTLLRHRVPIAGQYDLPSHYCVSASLAVQYGQDYALSAGIAKEIADSLPGGTGFSFVDLAINQAGIRWGTLATESTQSAREMQFRLMDPNQGIEDIVPDISGLPEDISAEEFENDYGGLGGKKSREIFAEINRRIEACEGLR
jgi:hypothetical protein